MFLLSHHFKHLLMSTQVHNLYLPTLDYTLTSTDISQNLRALGGHSGDMLFGLTYIPPMKLNACQIHTEKPKDKLYKLSDHGRPNRCRYY